MTTSTASPVQSVEVDGKTVSVGDFFSSSWGYDQTNVTFYKVVGFSPSGKSVKVQKWTQAFTSNDGGPCTYVVPGPVAAQSRVWNKDYTEQTVEEAPVMTKRFSKGWVGLTMSSYEWATPWDGEPQYQTGGGWGH